MSKVEVVRGTELERNALLGESSRAAVFKRKSAVMARFILSAGAVSPWHHHGSRELLGFLVKGSLRLEYRSKSTGSVDLAPGDFFRIPRKVIHRDVNLSKSDPVVVVSLYLGSGPVAVNLGELAGSLKKGK